MVADPMTVPLAVTIWAVWEVVICVGWAAWAAGKAVAIWTTCHFVGSLGSCCKACNKIDKSYWATQIRYERSFEKTSLKIGYDRYQSISNF